MKQRFHTLDDAANVLNTTVYALLQAAEAGELTLALPTHGKYLFRFCPRERGKYYPDMQFMSCDCIPVPPHTISVLLANQLTTEPEPATFCQVEFPSNAGSWIEFWHIDDFLNRDIPTSTPGLIIRLSESSLRITDAELERVAAGREQDDLFDLVGPDPRRLDLSGIRQGIERLTYMVATEQDAEPAPVTPAPAGASEQDAEPAIVQRLAQQPNDKGIPKREILAVGWPLPGRFNQTSLSAAMSDVPDWLKPARTARGSPGVASALWNPAKLADCLAEKKYANWKAIDTFLRKHFAKWLPEWEKLQEYR